MPVKEKSRKSPSVTTPTDAHLYQQPTEELLLQLVGKEMYSKWNSFGVYLGIKQNVRDGIKQQTQGDPEACFIKLCSKWLYSFVGTGRKPRTWKTVLNAVRECEYPQVADDAEKTLLLRLTKTDIAVHCIDKYEDQLKSICLAKKARQLKALYLLSSIPRNGLCPLSDVFLHYHIIEELKEAIKRDHENMDIFCAFLRLEFSANVIAMKIASDMKGDFDRGTSSLKCSFTNFIEDNRDPVAADTEGCLRSQNRDEGYSVLCPKHSWIVSGTIATFIALLVIIIYMMQGSELQDDSVPNLPGLPTAFTGRSEEIEDILSALLQKQIQVVAITGGPGYGKSSLAIVCAHKLARKGFNVHHILLNEVSTIVRFTSKVLMAFDELHNDKQLEDTLLMQIKALKQATILVLDNADHLTLETSCTMSSFLALLRKMTSKSSLLKMIVTTRYRFNMIDGFRQIHLQALSNNFTIDLLSSLLLTSSVSKSSPAATNSFHIQQIANLTGGIPLAVKVVCQLLNAQIVSVDEVVEGLSVRPVHTLSHETFSPEERLNRCFNLSYTYLSKPAKLCFVYASRFPDAFSIKAGRAIVANLSTDLECLPKLVDRSLLEYDVQTKRYSMHLLLRHFVQEQESVRKNNIRKWKFWKLYVNFYMDHLLSLYVNTNTSFYSAVYSSIDLEYEHFLLSFTLLSEDETNQDAPILMPISHQLDIAEKTFHVVQAVFPPDILTKWWSLVLTHSCRGSNSSNLYGYQLCRSMLTDSPVFTPFVSFVRKLGQFWIYEKKNVFAARKVYEFAFKSTQGDVPIGPKISCKPMSEPEYVSLLQDLTNVYKMLHQFKDAQALSDAIDKCKHNMIHQEKDPSIRLIDLLPKNEWCSDALLNIIVPMSLQGNATVTEIANIYSFKYMLDYFNLISHCKTPDVAMKELQILESNLLFLKFQAADICTHSRAMLSMSKIWKRLHGNVSREVYWLEKAASILGDVDLNLFSRYAKFVAHFRLARLYFTKFGNVSKALHHSQAAYGLATTIKNSGNFGSLILFKSVFRFAVLLFLNESFNTSLQYFQQATNMLPHMYDKFKGSDYFTIQREIQAYLLKLCKVLDMSLDTAIGIYYQWYKTKAKTSIVFLKNALDTVFEGSFKFIFMSPETALTLSNEPHVNAGSDILRLFKTLQLHVYAYSSYMWTQVLWILAFAILLVFTLFGLVGICLPTVCFLSLSSKGSRLYYYNIILILPVSFHYFLYCAIRNGQLWLPTRLPFLSVPSEAYVVVLGCSCISLAHLILSYSLLAFSTNANECLLFHEAFDGYFHL